MVIKKELFDILRENSYKQIDLQFSAVSSIESKTTSMLTILLAILTLLTSIFTIADIKPEWNFLLTLGVIAMTLSFILLMKSLFCRNLSTPAETERFLTENKKNNINIIRVNFTDDCRKAVNRNVFRLNNKGRDFNIGTAFLIVAVVLIASGIIKGRWFNMKDDTQKPSPSVSQQSGAATPSGGNTNDSSNNQSSGSGLPDNRQGTTLDIFKGAEEPVIKKNK